MGKTWRKHKIERKEQRRLERMARITTAIRLLDAELIGAPDGPLFSVQLNDELELNLYGWGTRHKTFGPYSNPARALSALTQYRSKQRGNA